MAKKNLISYMTPVVAVSDSHVEVSVCRRHNA